VILSGIAVIAFIIWELKSKEPIVDLRVLLNRNFAVGTSLMIVMGIVLYGKIALLPLFLQTLLGYPAVSSGMAVSPRGFGAIVSMLIVGRMIGKIRSRYLIMFGFTVLGYSTYLFSKINLEISISSIVYPSIISGFAMGFIFVPLTTMALGTLSNEQMGNASGVFNLMRNTGGSMGIAMVTTLLARGTQIHQAALVGNLSPYNPVFQQRLKQLSDVFATRSGQTTGMQQAYASLYGTLVRQAAVLSYADVFRLLAFLCLLCIPATLLFERVKAKPGAVPMH
jgi:DHA2 family multidrug resistance protein